MRDRRELELHGFEVPPMPGAGGPGAWDQAQRLALELQARGRRN